ncbi:MAG: tetratricopeptide repeat protein [Thermoplasmata archaeon]|nr:tetratricopeptide repeat protein [Thermoplasmata archaeon]
MEPADILVARAMRALLEGDPADAERLVLAVPEGARGCRGLAVLSVSRLRQGGAALEPGDCDGHPSWAAVLIESAPPGEIATVVEAAVLREAGAEDASLIVDAADAGAARCLERSDYASALGVYDSLCRLEDGRDRLAWGVERVLERVEVKGDYERLAAALPLLRPDLAEEVRLSVERQYGTAIQRERFDRALEYLRHFGGLDRGSLVAALVDSGKSSETYGTPADAIERYRLASEISDDDGLKADLAGRVSDIAKRAIAGGNLDLGMRVLGEVSAFADVPLYEHLQEVAHGLVREGRYDEAVDLYLRLGDERPGTKTAYHLKDIANRLRTEGRTDEAIALYGRISSMEPGFDLDHYIVLVGVELAREGAHAMALAVLGRISAETPELLLARAASLEGLGRTAEAGESLEAALTLRPDDLGTLRALLAHRERHGDHGKAFILARKAHSIDGTLTWPRPTLRRGMSRRIAAAEDRGDYVRAADLYIEFLEMFPGDRWAKMRLDLVLDILRMRDKKAWRAAMERLGRETGRGRILRRMRGKRD